MDFNPSVTELCECREVRMFKWRIPGFHRTSIFTILLEHTIVSFTPTKKMIPLAFAFDPDILSSQDSFLEVLTQNFFKLTPALTMDSVRDMAGKVNDYVAKNFVFGGIEQNTMIIVAADLFHVLSYAPLNPIKIVKNPDFGVEEIASILRNYFKDAAGLFMDAHLWIEVPAVEEYFRGVVKFSEEDKCAICLEDFSGKLGKAVKKTKCSHLFHGQCIGRWLFKNRSCPMCRLPM